MRQGKQINLKVFFFHFIELRHLIKYIGYLILASFDLELGGQNKADCVKLQETISKHPAPPPRNVNKPCTSPDYRQNKTE